MTLYNPFSSFRALMAARKFGAAEAFAAREAHRARAAGYPAEAWQSRVRDARRAASIAAMPL